MAFSRLLVANRGEIAVRIVRAAADIGIETVAVYAEDDNRSLHVHLADDAVQLSGSGPAAYLDAEAIVSVAEARDCDAVHPGYGFLSERPHFARLCGDAGIAFVGPNPEALELFGDKSRARSLAADAGVPIVPGTGRLSSAADAVTFFDTLESDQSMMLKAVAGGGGRGMRIVDSGDEVVSAFERCRSEAKTAFGDDAIYAELFLPRVRHIEVQILGDTAGFVTHAGERDCSIQRRNQKLIEIAPAPGITEGLRRRITDAAVVLAGAASYDNVGTFEFLVDAGTALSDSSPFHFMEANARLQVEHTVTEQVTGIDLVQTQIELANGRSLRDLGLDTVPSASGFAIESRVNIESMAEDGTVLPASGTLIAFDPPSGPAVRVDTFGYTGYETNSRYDSLLAKVITRSSSARFGIAAARAERALSEFRIEGVASNNFYLRAVLSHPDFQDGDLHTAFVAEHSDELLAAAKTKIQRFVPPSASGVGPAQAGATIDADDPLAVLIFGQQKSIDLTSVDPETALQELVADGVAVVTAPIQGTVVSILVKEGDAAREGQAVLVMESMKMEHEIKASTGGFVNRVAVAAGDIIYEGTPLLYIQEADVSGSSDEGDEDVDLDYIRPDLREIVDRHALTHDDARPAAVARRRAKDQRTARENVLDLCDDGTFVEYGGLVLAAQRRRRSEEELIVKSPADGMVTGVGSINGDLFDAPASQCAVLSYDYTVFAGTQGTQNHRKTDRLIDVAESGRMPLILFAEGGGGRPGDTDGVGVSNNRTFARFAQLSGLVPMVAITSGRCFAGNASLLGCCDVIIATEDSNIGMGGPAMVEGGGLGVYAPEEIGPMSVQIPSGVVDIAVKDEEEAVVVAKKYLSYFQGRAADWKAPDQRAMRRIIPENRLRVYDVRQVITTLVDEDSVLELRPNFGVGMLTTLVRVEGRPLGIIANNPVHLGGAIDSDGADKGARFMQICDAFDIPLLFLCDTPGIMVGPEIEKTALVRHSSRMFLVGANLSVPFFTIILRKAYGLGAIAMAGGSYRTPFFSVAWPTGEFGGMGLEGSVKLGYREDLAAIDDPEERTRVYEEMVAKAYEHGRALNQATHFGVDDTIDPADSRHWVASLMRSVRPPEQREGKKRPVIDAW